MTFSGKKSFKWIETDPKVNDKLVVRVATTGHVVNRWVRIDLASRGFISDENTEYIHPNGTIFKFKR